MHLLATSGRSLAIWTVGTALVVAILAFPPTAVHAQDLKSPSEYAKDEARRALEETISEAQKALQALDTPQRAPQPGLRLGLIPQGQPRIVNGVGSFRYPATGALLNGNDPKSARLYCTGTLVSCDKFLVAAHCVVQDPDPAQYQVYFQVAGFFRAIKLEWPRDIYSYPNPNADVAVVTLDRPVEGIVPERVNFSVKPPYGTEGTIVGFGRTGGDRDDYGLKREGYVRTASCTAGRSNDALVCWNFDAMTQAGARRSNTCNADSGGPLFVNGNVGNEPVRIIAGVTGGGDARSNCLVGDHAYDTNLFEYRTWLQNAGVPQTPPAICGAQANIDINRHALGVTFHLSARNAEFVRTIDVGSDIKQLMVAMNAEDDGEGRNDFDLYLIKGRESDVARAVCKENGAGQFAFCSVQSPQAGPWTIVTRRKAGDGSGQIVVTRVSRDSQ